MAAFWMVLATAPAGFSVPEYEPPASDLTVTAPLLWKPAAWCAQPAGPAQAGAAAATRARPANVAALRPD